MPCSRPGSVRSPGQEKISRTQSSVGRAESSRAGAKKRSVSRSSAWEGGGRETFLPARMRVVIACALVNAPILRQRLLANESDRGRIRSTPTSCRLPPSPAQLRRPRTARSLAPLAWGRSPLRARCQNQLAADEVDDHDHRRQKQAVHRKDGQTLLAQPAQEPAD